MLNYFLISDKHLNDINPMECGTEDCQPGYGVGPMSRDFYLIHYVFSGCGTFITGGKEYPVGKGQLFIIHPHEIVHYRADEKTPWDYCWVGFTCNIEVPVLLEGHVVTLPGAEAVFNGLKFCDRNMVEKEYYICGKVYELFALMQQVTESERRKPVENIERAKNFIDANYVSPITVEQLADHLGINRSYFSTSFKRIVGCSPQQYLVDVRLNKAAELMTQYGYSASAAAISCGYADIFNFSKMFKRKFGLSPTAYVKAKKQE